MNTRLAIAWSRYLSDRMGWPGLLGLALAASAAIVEVAVVADMSAGNGELRAEIAREQERLAAKPAAPPPAVESRKLEDLPDGGELLPIVAAVHASARRRLVAIDQGEYVWQRDPRGRTARYRMTFPARGSYPQLRGWAADLLAQRPELTLEEFNFRRESIGSEQVEARIRFVIGITESRS